MHRDTVRQQMADPVGRHWPDDNFPAILEHIADLEAACYKEAVDRVAQQKGNIFRESDPLFCNKYSSICYRVLTALDERLVFPHEINAAAEVLTPIATAPFEKEVAARRDARVKFKRSTLNKCRRAACDSDIIDVKKIQTRSADEMAKMSYICRKCNHTWQSS